jgi:alkylation response protein AidB-like acyl-CoA dehydrogenase
MQLLCPTWKIAPEARILLFAAWLGFIERHLRCTIAHTGAREQFGKPIGNFQSVSHQSVYHEQNAAGEVALAKIAVTQAAVEPGLDAAQLHDQMGIVIDADLARLMWDRIPGIVSSSILKSSGRLSRVLSVCGKMLQ